MLDEEKVSQQVYFDNKSKVRFCEDLAGVDWNDYNLNERKDQEYLKIGSHLFKNPSENLLVLKDSIMLSLYNNQCFINETKNIVSNNLRNQYICPNTNAVALRTSFNNSVNSERSLAIILNSGTTGLNLGDKWCWWWNTKCRFQIDLYASSKVNSTTFAFIQDTKFAYYRRNDLKNKYNALPLYSPLNFVRWDFESGLHGDERKFVWTGKHRKEGTETTHTMGQQLNGSVNFKPTESSTNAGPLGIQSNLSFSVKKTAKDVDFGGDFAYFCDNINERHCYSNCYNGKWLSTGADIDFLITEVR
ncbi:hypothetical protein [Portibacter marinus]|uniref:hypothetical protein n=1 Tax=Portibacter marinus TaxID=2898660 RepID=UPI001F19EAAE|nr:hypothetical protein [Portibacter marinus]